MTYAELKTHAANTVMNRSDLVANIATALQFAHTAIQRDTLTEANGVQHRLEWPCMEKTTATIVYAAGNADGLALTEFDANLNRIEEVWNVGNDETGSDPIRPATAEEIRLVRRFERDEFRMTSVSSQAYHQRWFIESEKFKLLFPPASTESSLNLRAKIIRRLPFYTADADSDYFSTVLPDVLCHWAAAYAWTWVGEDAEAARYSQFAMQGAIQAYKSARANALGAHAGPYRPPTAQGRKY